MNLKTWAAGLSPESQEIFFKQATLFFTNSELMDIISNIKSGDNLYKAHLRAGVFDRYVVDLENLKQTMH